MDDVLVSTPGVAITGRMPNGVRPRESATFRMLEKPKYRWAGVEFSAVEPAVNSWPRAVIERIRALEPDFLPLVIRTLYLTASGSRLVFERHALCYQTHDPKAPPRVPFILWPTTPGTINFGRERRGAVVIEDVLEFASDRDDGLPGAYQPFDWRTYRKFVQAAADQRSAEEQYRAVVEGKAERIAAARRALFDRIDYEWKQDEAYDRSLAQAVSSSEIDQIGHARPERKPFVHVKGAA